MIPEKTIARTLVPLALLLAACEGITDPPPPLEGNVLAQVGASVEVNDTAVVVDGVRLIEFGDYNRSLRLAHQTLYEYGGIGDFETDVLRDESWFFRFSHRIGPAAPDARYVDHGRIELADTVLWKTTEGDFVGYGTASFARVRYLDGRVVTFAEAGHLDAILEREPIRITSTGSGQATPFDTSFTAYPPFTVTAVRNGGPVEYREERPVVQVDHALVLELDRTLAPENHYMWLSTPASPRDASAVLQLMESSDRIVIPADVLSELLGALGEDSGEFIFVLSEYHTDRDLITGTLLEDGEPFALDFVQNNSLRMFLRLE